MAEPDGYGAVEVIAEEEEEEEEEGKTRLPRLDRHHPSHYIRLGRILCHD